LVTRISSLDLSLTLLKLLSSTFLIFSINILNRLSFLVIRRKVSYDPLFRSIFSGSGNTRKWRLSILIRLILDVINVIFNGSLFLQSWFLGKMDLFISK
jgi:hypothetical protein